MKLPVKFRESIWGGNPGKDFQDKWQKLVELIQGKSKDENWAKSNPKMKELVGKRFSPGSGVDSLDNTKPWSEVQTIFNDKDVQAMLNREKDLNKKWTEVRNAWNEWSESSGGGSSGSSSGGKGGGSDSSKSGSSEWDPR